MRAVNLIPAEQRGGGSVGAGRSEGAVYILLGTVAGLALMGLLYGLARHQEASRTGEVATLEARAQQAQAAASSLAPYTNFVNMREQRTQAVEELVNSRFDWAHELHEFGRVLPAGVSITSLTGTVGSSGATGATTAATPSSSPSPSSTASSSAAASSASAASSVTSATPPGSVPTFSVAGCAISQTTVAQTIARLRLIDGVSSVTLVSSTKSAAGASASGGAGCGPGQAIYAINVAFQPLPASSGPTTTTTVAANGASGRTQ